MSEWQPIETAPKNGDEVLIYDGEDGVIVVAYWNGDKWHDGEWPRRPTHWMPLPEPPAEPSP